MPPFQSIVSALSPWVRTLPLADGPWGPLRPTWPGMDDPWYDIKAREAFFTLESMAVSQETCFVVCYSQRGVYETGREMKIFVWEIALRYGHRFFTVEDVHEAYRWIHAAWNGEAGYSLDEVLAAQGAWRSLQVFFDPFDN